MGGPIVTPSERSAKGVLERLEELFEIGRGVGANRPGLSREEQQACEFAAGWMEEAGLEVSWDPAGNLTGRLPGSRADLPEVWTGSHLDTVPDGGRFDGALGVVAGIEALERIAGDGQPERTLAVVAFRDEEGWRFPGGGFFGSRALCGRLPERALESSDRAGITIQDALASLGIGPPPAGGWLERGPGVYLETHIEQGPVLARADAPLGLVTAIAGMAGGWASFTGREGHAGTTPMDARHDALWAASEFVLAVRQAASGLDGAVATVGSLMVEPGAANVIPRRVTATIDARAPERATLDELVGAIRRAAGEAEVRLDARDPVPMAERPRAALRAEIERLGLPVLALPSGAGHDAGVLGAAGVEVAMLFVRSLAGGVSHSPDEDSSEEDIALAVEALTGALRRLASAPTR